MLRGCCLQKEKVAPGDVIYIESNSGAVKRVGRQASFPHAHAACSGRPGAHARGTCRLQPCDSTWAGVHRPPSTLRVAGADVGAAAKAPEPHALSLPSRAAGSYVFRILAELVFTWTFLFGQSSCMHNTAAAPQVRRIRHRVRPGGGGVRAASQGRCAQAKGGGAGEPGSRREGALLLCGSCRGSACEPRDAAGCAQVSRVLALKRLLKQPGA